MAAKDAGNDAEFHRLLDREDDAVTTMIAVEDEIEEHIGTSLLALGAAILIEMRRAIRTSRQTFTAPHSP